MKPSRITHLKLVGASSAALMIAAAAAAPAIAAGPATAQPTYSCYGGAVALVTNISVNGVPTKLVAGQVKNAPTTATLDLGAAATSLLTAQGMKTVDGAVNAPPTTKIGLDLTVPNTPVGNSGGGADTVVTGSGKALLRYPKAGTFPVATGDFVANLNGYDASGTPTNYVIACTAPSDGSTAFKDSAGNPVTIKVSKDTTTTTTTAKYASAKKTINGKAKVASHYGLAPTGKVKFVLKRGTHKVGAVTAKVSKKGVAKSAFKSIKTHGTYTLKATYVGNKGLKASHGKATVKVG